MPTTSGSVTVSAPGKINVCFLVGPLLPSGYHRVASVYQAVSLLEHVTATATDEPGIGLTVEFTPGSVLAVQARRQLDSGVDLLAAIPRDATNLAARAAALVLAASDWDGGVRLHLSKAVPVAGGMGGGSADAAAALVACDALLGTALGTRALARLGEQLGADVPFALLGGVAVGLGTGTELTSALAPVPFHWVLLTAGFGISTPRTYAALDEHRQAVAGGPGPEHIPVPAPPAEVLHALRAGDPHRLAAVLRNDLQEPALTLAPRLRPVLAEGLAAGALAGIVSGSGPTLALLCADEDDADAVATSLGHRGLDAVPVTGPVAGAQILSRAGT
ncbi:4-(cytidine 5'-diphospho)-2-C-methyl-D-erythritol kinase [Tersicoccus phoenicis]|uniref:4-diphosphocytidyl-2-C-methyl-D-erythritol kinase n=1 Tax=Tersicoccus phoenicis TaxID=554083 RepID=A0A1R1L8G3_9MICC|nr:4-(cytidine 5'-diphospho)-2-C-methyl-D-erythritol kinase [Tersicoccus phoenicis]OMH23840.1 4-(cytidine 5'-diphospho)-2-C-methyl-D-erythritol kinase [Tersicoccus phoenicis]